MAPEPQVEAEATTLLELVARQMRQSALDWPVSHRKAPWSEALHPSVRDYWLGQALLVLALVASRAKDGAA